MKRNLMISGTAALVLLVVLSLWHVVSLKRAEALFLDRTAAILAQVPDREQDIVTAAKAPDSDAVEKGYNLLAKYGYSQGKSAFLQSKDYAAVLLPAGTLALCAGVVMFFLRQREISRQQRRVDSLAEYIGRVNAGEYSLRPQVREDMLSPLEDELYKSIVLLREGREQAASAYQSLADNLADIAHQLKTPLSSITLLADLLADHETEQVSLRAVQIGAQAEKMERLVKTLLTLSRADAGTLKLEQKQVDVGELCQCAADAVTPLFSGTHLKLLIPDTDASFAGDMQWSIEALSNIIKNCYEHTGTNGEIIITAEENPLYTSISIRDNGPGIAPEDLPRLFERFYRGKDIKKDSVGIGLALAKVLIEAQNGTLNAENHAEGGALFTIKFYHSR